MSLEQNENKKEKFLDWQESCERLGNISKKTLDELTAKGVFGVPLQHADAKNSKRFWQESALDAYIKSRFEPQDLTGKLAELAVNVEPKPRDWRHERNQGNLPTVYANARELLKKIESENQAEIFWKASLWEIRSRIKKNILALLTYVEDFDDEIFTAAFLAKLLGRQLTFWANLIQPVNDKQSGLNEKLLAVNLPEGQGVWVRTMQQGHEQNIRLGGKCYKIKNIFQAIPAPVSPEDERTLFNHRNFLLKVDKAGVPRSFEEQQQFVADGVTRKKELMSKLCAEKEEI